MFKLLALNETSQGASSSDKTPRDTKEAQEAQAFKLYNEALRLQQIDCRDEAVQVYEQLLKTPLVVDSATSLVNEHNEAVEHPLKDSGLILKYSAHKNVASICASKGDKKKAMENYLQAVMLDTSDVALWYKIGILAAKLSNLHLSRRALTQGLECNPNHWPCLDSLISVCYALLDYENCLRWISKALLKDSFYKKGIFLRRKMIKECPHLQRDFDHIFESCGPQVFELYISEEDGNVFLHEAFTLRENLRRLCIPQEIPCIPLHVPLKSLSWLSLGKSLIATYKFIETREEPISVTSPIDMKVFGGVEVESNFRELSQDVPVNKVEDKCGRSVEKPDITDSDSKSNCAAYESTGSSNLAEMSVASKMPDASTFLDTPNSNKSRKPVKRKRPPEKISEQGRRSERRSSRMKPRTQNRFVDEPSPSPDLDFRYSLLKLLPKALHTHLKPLSMDADSDTNSQDSSIVSCLVQTLNTTPPLTESSHISTAQTFQDEICLSSAIPHPADDEVTLNEVTMHNSSDAVLACTGNDDNISISSLQNKVCSSPMTPQLMTTNEKLVSHSLEQNLCPAIPINGNFQEDETTEMSPSKKLRKDCNSSAISKIQTGDLAVDSANCQLTNEMKLGSEMVYHEKNGDHAGEKSDQKVSEAPAPPTIRKVSKEELEEERQVKKFIEEYNDTNNGILNLLLMFCKSIGRRSHVMWEAGLKEVFLQAFDIMQPSLRVAPFIKSKLSTKNKILFAYYMLTHLECSLDCKYKKHSNDFEYFPSELEYRDMSFIIDASYHPEILELDALPQYRFKNFVLRFHWVRANYFFLSGDKRSVIGELTMCSKLCMDMEIMLHHLENHNVINSETIGRRINSLKRFQLLEEIDQLLDCGKFSEALKLLQSHMKPTDLYLQEICKSSPNHNSPDLERPKLLNYLIKASLGLNDISTLLGNLLNCLHESVQQLPLLHVKKASKESKSYHSWQDLCATCCSHLAGIVEKNEDNLMSVGKDALATLVNDLVSLNHHYLVSLPAKSQSVLKGNYLKQIFTPWVLLFHATRFAEAILSESVGRELPSCILMLISAHDWFGEKGYCCADNGVLVRLLLKELMVHVDKVNETSVASNEKLDVSLTDLEKSKDMPRSNVKAATCIEQCFFCLFGYPNRLSKSSRLVDHGSQAMSLKWQDAFSLYKYYKPISLPAFDSYKVNTILNDMAGLLLKILKIVPDKIQGKLMHSLKAFDAYLKAEDITKELEIEPVCGRGDRMIIGDIYYLLADYYFKNKDMPQAGKYYMYDICINPRRFDSWAALALVKSSILDQRIRLCSSKLHNQVTGKEESILVYSKSTLFCFKRAMKIEDYSTTLWIEYGTFAYWMHSYFSRQIKLKKHASEEAVALWRKKRSSMLHQAEICFESALSCDSDDISSEEWLILYMLGKVQEKKCESPQKFLPHYSRAASLLHQKHAKYPKKIQFKSYQTDYAIESLEMYFRIHCSVLKLVQHEINFLNGFDDGEERKPLTREDFDIFSDIIEEAEGSNFVRRESLQSHQLYDKPPDTNPKKSTSQTKLTPSVNESQATLSMGTLVPDAIVSALSSQLTVAPSMTENLMETNSTVSTEQSDLEFTINPRHPQLMKSGEEVQECPPSKEIMPIRKEAPPLTRERRLQMCGKTLKSCVSALHLCLGRLPQHYKAIYRLADLYWRCPPDSQHISWCCDLLLGSSTPWQTLTHMPCQGLLSERNKTNLFNGVWKIPVDEIDRPGSFGYHLYHCILMLLDVLLALKDHRKLFYLHNMLNRTPDQGRKYLKDTDRVLVCKKSLSYCIKALYKKVSCIKTSDCLNSSERLQYLMDASKICQQKQRMSDPVEDILNKKQTEMHKELLILSYEKYIVGLPPIATPLPNLDFVPAVVKVERILKFCQQHVSSFPSTPKSHLSSFSQKFDFNMIDVSSRQEIESSTDKPMDLDGTREAEPVNRVAEPEEKQHLKAVPNNASGSDPTSKKIDDRVESPDVLEYRSSDAHIQNANIPTNLPVDEVVHSASPLSKHEPSLKFLTDQTHELEKQPVEDLRMSNVNVELEMKGTSGVHGSDSALIQSPKNAPEFKETGHSIIQKDSPISQETSHSITKTTFEETVTTSLMTSAEESPSYGLSVSPNIASPVTACSPIGKVNSPINPDKASTLPKAELTTVTQGDRTYTKIIPCKQNPSLSPSPHSAFTPRKKSANLQIFKIKHDNRGLLVARSTSLPETSKTPGHRNLHRTGSVSEYTKQRLKSSILMKTSASLVKKPSITETEIDQILCDIESSQSEEEEDVETAFQPLTTAPTKQSSQSPCHPVARTSVSHDNDFNEM